MSEMLGYQYRLTDWLPAGWAGKPSAGAVTGYAVTILVTNTAILARIICTKIGCVLITKTT